MFSISQITLHTEKVTRFQTQNETACNQILILFFFHKLSILIKNVIEKVPDYIKIQAKQETSKLYSYFWDDYLLKYGKSSQYIQNVEKGLPMLSAIKKRIWGNFISVNKVALALKARTQNRM